jgi:hypothetical protein
MKALAFEVRNWRGDVVEFIWPKSVEERLPDGRVVLLKRSGPSFDPDLGEARIRALAKLGRKTENDTRGAIDP